MITKEQFLKLKDPNITKGEYNSIINSIADRFTGIMWDICSSLGWWDYRNEVFYPENYDVDDDITLDGEYSIPEPYDNGIPIRWLWEDYREEFDKNVLEYENEKKLAKQKAKEKREKLKAKKQEMKQIISQKLTKEELKYIKFK